MLWAAATAACLQGDDSGVDRRGRPIRDFEAGHFEDARSNVANASLKPGIRTSEMSRLIHLNALEALDPIAEQLDDPSEEVRIGAAQWLAHAKDKRGLDWLAACLTDPACSYRRHQALRLLGIGARPEYAPLVAETVRSAMKRGQIRDGVWNGRSEDRAQLLYGTIALARMGRREDHDLVIEVVRMRPNNSEAFLEALGYVSDAASKDILWSAYKKMLRSPSCDEHGLGVPALVQLARLGESSAIEELKEILKGVGTPPDTRSVNGIPQLCVDRAAAFDSLRQRDARHFAETVFEVAARQPEGPATRMSWNALGVMHPEGYGPSVLKLAVSKKPHWDLVSRGVLNTVVIAIDPGLNEAFWSEFEVEAVPEMRGDKNLVKAGLGRMMFHGSFAWTSD
jgi:hypothetical protein